jgi:SAM-dependent methyltransferase
VTVIGDSNAVRIEGRVLVQHQAALTLLQRHLSAPNTERLAWLDLACGRGQILSGLRENLSDEARGKIDFSAYDVKQEYLLETHKTASSLGFSAVRGCVGDLADFDRVLPDGERYDFITLTNTVHEVAAERLANVLVDAIRRLRHHGTAFLYDMERIKPPELGALPWRAEDLRIVALTVIRALGETVYQPEVGRWQHTTVSGWNLQIQREHIAVTIEECDERRENAAAETQAAIVGVMSQRLARCQAALEALTIYGSQTVEEQEEREHLLYEHWALTRSLEASA